MKFIQHIPFGILILLLTTTSVSSHEAFSMKNAVPGDSVVLVRTETAGAGSGVVIHPMYVLTAEHVVKDDSRIRVETAHRFISATVFARDSANDVAILKLLSPIDRPAIAVRNAPLKLEETVTMLGFAQAKWTLTETAGRVIGIQSSVTSANSTAATEAKPPVSWIRVSEPVTHGMSGGPVLDADQKVVSVIVAVTLEGGVPTNGIIVPNHAVISLVAKIPELNKAGLLVFDADPNTILTNATLNH